MVHPFQRIYYVESSLIDLTPQERAESIQYDGFHFPLIHIKIKAVNELPSNG